MTSTTKWITLALLGLAIAAAVAFLASRLVSEQIGIASESVSAGYDLAPAVRSATAPNNTGNKNATPNNDSSSPTDDQTTPESTTDSPDSSSTSGDDAIDPKQLEDELEDREKQREDELEDLEKEREDREDEIRDEEEDRRDD